MTHTKKHGVASTDDHEAGTNDTLIGTVSSAVDEVAFSATADADKIVKRDGSGDVIVPTTPGGSNAAASKAYADALIAANDAMVYKGVIDCSVNPDYPAADAGHAYKVSVAGKIGGVSGPNVEVGDILLCCVDSSASGDHATVGANWNIIQVNIDGAVTGPASATDHGIARYDGVSGVVVEDSNATIDDNGSINIPVGETYDIDGSPHDHDDAYFTEAEHLDASAGGDDAGKPVKLDAGGQIDTTMINDADIDHNNTSNIKTDGTADYNHLRAEVALTGAAPVRADVAAWNDGDCGIGVGTGGARYFITRKDADEVFAVEMTEVGS